MAPATNKTKPPTGIPNMNHLRGLRQSLARQLVEFGVPVSLSLIAIIRLNY
jgi:hypothetical protein